MARDDRHGRVLRVDGDHRRRPADGFRTRDRRRFTALVRQTAAALPGELRGHIDGTELRVSDVPDPDAPADPIDGVLLARLDLGGAGRAAVLEVYRRPLEARAEHRADLIAVIDAALRNAIRDALGLPRHPDD